MNKQKIVLFIVLLVTTRSQQDTNENQVFDSKVPYEVMHSLQQEEHIKVYKLQYTGTQTHYKGMESSPMPKIVHLMVQEDSENEVTIIIGEENSFKIPLNSYFPTNKVKFSSQSKNYKYSVLPKSDTIFTLDRILDDGQTEPIFNAAGMEFYFSKYYSTISTSLNNNFVYGFGERRKKFRYDSDGTYSTYPKDYYGQIDSGQPNQQTYGYHPMWLKKEQTGNFHVGFLKSTSPLQTVFVSGQKMTLNIVGGQIYLKFFLGDSQPENVIKAYHNYINGYGIHPFWSMGYHQSRWGYNSSAQLIQIRNQFDQNLFPIDVMWNDLDYMQDYKQFTLQPNYKSSEMNQLTDLNTINGIQWVPLIDIGLEISTNAAFNGLKMGVFMNSSIYKGQPLIGCVWPGSVYYPDFNHPNSFKFWNQSLYSFRTNFSINPAGFWIDMNELSNFIPGERSPTEECPGATPPIPPEIKSQVDDRNFLPFNVDGDDSPLSYKSTTVTTQHYSGSDGLLINDQQNIQELFFHSLNGLGEAIATHKSLQTFSGFDQTFILSRSSMYGTGRYAAHWTGDNLATWEFFQYAVSELLPFQLFGIPLVGNDLCGFAMDTNAELCTRWLQLGAWMPFSRNHNSNVSIPQEPFAFSNDDYVLPTTRTAFERRYSYLKWMYSLFIANYDNNSGFASGTIMKPLWWNFPSDSKAYDHEDTQFMFGNEIMIAPVLTKSNEATKLVELNVYFPGNYQTQWQELFGDSPAILDGGSSKTYNLRLTDDIPYFQLAGTTVPTQEPALRTRLLSNQFTLQIVLKKDPNTNSFQSQGQMMTVSQFDEKSISENCLKERNCITNIQVQGEIVENQFNGFVSFAAQNENTVFQSFSINSLKIYGINNSPIIVKLDGGLHVSSSIVHDINFQINLETE